MQTYKNCEAVYKRIVKGEKLSRKIKFKWWIYRIVHLDFTGREMVYEQMRKQERKLYIHHVDRERDYSEILTVAQVIEKEWEDEIFVEGFGPIQKSFIPLKKNKDE